MEYNLINILLVVLILAAIVLLIYAVFFLRKLGNKLDQITGEVQEISSRTKPLLEGLQEVNGKLLKITSDAEGYVYEVGETIHSIKLHINYAFEKMKEKAKHNPVTKVFGKIFSSEDDSEE